MDSLFITENIQPIFNLFLSLAEHFGLISAVAFILLSTKTLQRMISRELTLQDKLALILFFGAFGIFGTYDGDPIHGVIANLRAISMIIAGLIGGPLVGFGAGLIAGGHRYLTDMSGFSSLPCALGTLLEGTAAGLVSMRLKEHALNWRVAAMLGIIGESVHMGLIVVMAQPLATALKVVQFIGIPMIILNSAGAACLIEMIQMVVRNRERRASMQAQKALAIANRTVTHLRQGLNSASAVATAGIIFEHIDVAAVAITNDQKVLAYVGVGDDAVKESQPLRTRITTTVIQTGQPVFLNTKAEVKDDVPQASIRSAIVVPLKKSDQVIGALKFYGDQKHILSSIDFQIAIGLADLFSTQLELEDIQVKAQLLAGAKIKRLEAQINPHFIFNALNTITYFCRTDSDRARELLVSLSTYLRRNLDDSRQFITLAEELDQVTSYLAIAQARSGDSIDYQLDIDSGVGDRLIPPLIVQPLVENAVKHGLAGKEQSGSIRIHARSVGGHLHVEVQDNGVGIPESIIAGVFQKSATLQVESDIGLRNVNQRLERIYGPSARLQILSRLNEGTTITLNLPNTRIPVI